MASFYGGRCLMTRKTWRVQRELRDDRGPKKSKKVIYSVLRHILGSTLIGKHGSYSSMGQRFEALSSSRQRPSGGRAGEI